MADSKKAPASHPSFFNPKSTATRFLTGLCNLIIVNLLFILTSIPVFTIGASLTALYRITIAILAGDNPAIFRDYFKAFKDNFLKATLLELLYAIVSAFFIFEVVMVNTMMSPDLSWVQYIPYFFLLLILAHTLYSFPLLAWFEESFGQILKNALLLSITNLPVTIMYVIFTAGLAYAFWQFPSLTASLMIFLGISLLALFYSLFLKRIFEKLGAEISFKDKEGDDSRR
ncbi:MAG: DUF624 domain-containing protein [Clostridiales bacterium]|nr:DUF624 domain-containing protein [Clostridiales bacterium]MBR6488634.1 DUF624 domain-containing protein [Clostridiales bacterium]